MQSEQQYQSFISWQCRLRKMSMRELGGRPTAGMSAGVYSVKGGEEKGRMNFLIIRSNPRERTDEFRHVVRKSPDSSQWVKHGLSILAELHYHEDKEFDNQLTALFSLDSTLAYALLKAGECHLKFAQDSIEHAFDFDVLSLNEDEELFQATYWHNRLFNPTLPGKVRVLGFKPRLQL
jgi:hypothetical protein